MKKAKALKEKSKENSGESESNDNNTENKKRKREDSEPDDGVKKHRDSTECDIQKKPLSQTTNSKLANFAFKKDES